MRRGGARVAGFSRCRASSLRKALFSSISGGWSTPRSRGGRSRTPPPSTPIARRRRERAGDPNANVRARGRRVSRTRARAGQRRGVPKRGLVVFSSTNTCCPPAFLPRLRHSRHFHWRHGGGGASRVRRAARGASRRGAGRGREAPGRACRAGGASAPKRVHGGTRGAGTRGGAERRGNDRSRGERAISTRRVRRAPDPSHPVHSPLPPPRSPSRRFPLACTR